jgi:hypothetical protein
VQATSCLQTGQIADVLIFTPPSFYFVQPGHQRIAGKDGNGHYL